MKTIWKFKLGLTDIQEVEMPLGSRILSAALDPFDELCIWAEVDSDAKAKEHRIIRIIGTGHPFTDSSMCKFLGTVTQRTFVWHIYVKD